jgi:uncharacterized membrane protein
MIENISILVGIGKTLRRIVNNPWFVGILGSIIGGILLYLLLERPDILVELYRTVNDNITISAIIIIASVIVTGIVLFILYKHRTKIKKPHVKEVISGEDSQEGVTIPSTISGLCLGRDAELVTLEKNLTKKMLYS